MKSIEDILNKKIKLLIEKLKAKNLQIGVSESLTGGMLASMIVNVEGASAVFKGGIVAYSPEIKTKILKVEKSIISEKGTVCSDVALQMARGAQEVLETDIAISTTGVAGPGSYEGKDAGTVYVGLRYLNKETSFLLKATGKREEIRLKTVEFCIDKTLSILSSQ